MSSLSTYNIKSDGLGYFLFSCKETIEVKHRLAAHWLACVLTACFTTQKIEKGLLLDFQAEGIVTEGSCFNTAVVYMPRERRPSITRNVCSNSMNTAVSYLQNGCRESPETEMSLSTFCRSLCDLFTSTGVQVGLPLQQNWFHCYTEIAEENRAGHTKFWPLLSVWDYFLLPLLFCMAL